MADEYIKRSDIIDVIESRQKDLCPFGKFGRQFVYGRERDAYDAWQEIIDIIDAMPAIEIEGD